MANQKPNFKDKRIIPNWGNILIDTVVIAKAILYVKNKKEENRFAYETIMHLADTKYQHDKGVSNRRFYVSAITVAELLYKLDDGVKKSHFIIQALNAKNMTIVDFDEDVANIFNSDFCEAVGVKVQNDILSRWGYEISKNNRQALTNDLMILASGLSVEMDVVLCYDKGMYKIARECGINAVYLEEKYFNISGVNYFSYDYSASDKDFNVTLKENKETAGLFDHMLGDDTEEGEDMDGHKEVPQKP